MSIPSQDFFKIEKHLNFVLISYLRIGCLLACLFVSGIMLAEGTREVSPTEDDWALLQLREGFANYGTAGTSNAMCVDILDPTEEVYLGLSLLGFSNFRLISNASYDFRIVDSLGNVVHGPFTVNPLNTNGSDYDDIVAGPNLGGGTGGYDVSNPMYRFSPGAIGTYCIEFNLTTPLTGAFLNEGIVWWDVTVTDSVGNPQLGRLFSENWSFRTPTDGDPDIFNQPFEGKVYVLTEGGFVHEVDFKDSGFRGLTFRLAFNDSGPGTTGIFEVDRRSINGVNATNPDFKIFLNDPDPNLYIEAGIGGIISGPFLRGGGPCDTLGGFCVDFTINQPGLVEIVLDLDGIDGVFTPNTRDRLLISRISPAGLITDCIPWDRLDGLGNLVDPFEGVPLFMRYSQGETHFMIHDVEHNNPGFTSRVIHPTNGIPNDLFYYDDSELDTSDNDNNLDGDQNPTTGVNPPIKEINGCPPPCHIWNNYPDQTVGYGESNTINTWWTGTVIVFPTVIDVLCKQDTLIVEKAITKIANSTSGSTDNFDVTFEILLKNEGTTTFDSLQIIDDLAANFGSSYIGLTNGPFITSNIGSPELPNPSAVFSHNLLDGISGLLRPGESIKVEFTVELNPNESGMLQMLSNQAEGFGINRFQNLISDLSDDIEDLTGNDDPTIVSFPRIGVAKRVTTIPAPDATSGVALNFDVSYEFIVKNIGDVPIENISLTDQIAIQFGGAFVGIVSSPFIETTGTTASTIGGVNSLFDGDTNIELLDSTGILLPDEQIVISVVVELSPYATDAIYHSSGFLANQAIASGLYDCAWVSDLSDEGTDPNDTEAPAGINSGTIGDTGGSDDPTLFPFEICGNGIDDDFDGRTDFEDNECEIGCSFIVTIEGGCDSLIVQMPQPDWAFQWFRDSVAIIGATSNIFDESSLDDGIYFVEITNSGGCVVPSNSIDIEDCCNPTTPEIIGIE